MEVYILGIIAAILVGISKTGMPGISIPAITLMLLVFPENTAIIILLPVLLVADVFAVLRFHEHADWKKLFGLLPAVLIGYLPGWYIMETAPHELLKRIVGGVILLIVTAEFLRLRYFSEKVPTGKTVVVATGASAGFATILAHAAMPVMSVYLASQKFDKERFVGTAAWFFLILNATKILPYSHLGLFDWKNMKMSLLFAPGALVGCFLGVFILSKISDKLFTHLALALAGCAALKLLILG